MRAIFYYNSTKVKKCPFCGSHPAIEKSKRYPRWASVMHWGWTVVCMNLECPIYNADGRYYLTRREAVEKWNTRYKEGENEQHEDRVG